MIATDLTNPKKSSFSFLWHIGLELDLIVIEDDLILADDVLDWHTRINWQCLLITERLLDTKTGYGRLCRSPAVARNIHSARGPNKHPKDPMMAPKIRCDISWSGVNIYIFFDNSSHMVWWNCLPEPQLLKLIPHLYGWKNIHPWSDDVTSQLIAFHL